MNAWRAALLGLALAGPAMAADTLRFWNLTGETVRDLRLAPAGTDAFGPNQCANDRDGTVDHDERLRLTGLEPGRYDVRLVFKSGRMCSAADITVRGEGRYAFSLAAKDLQDCHQ